VSNVLPGRTLNAELSKSRGREIVMIEAIAVSLGRVVRITFEDTQSPWRQGIWLGTEGSLRAGEASSPQLVLWADTTPPVVDVVCEQTDGVLRFYNVWDSGRGKGEFESQSATSGMDVEDLGDGIFRYACNDISQDPSFTKLIFRVENGDSSLTQ
jgi:hypothetical protein